MVEVGENSTLRWPEKTRPFYIQQRLRQNSAENLQENRLVSIFRVTSIPPLLETMMNTALSEAREHRRVEVDTPHKAETVQGLWEEPDCSQVPLSS